MEIRSGVVYKTVEEIRQQFRLQIANQPDFHPVLIYERWAASEIHRDYRESFVHRQYEIAGAVDAFAVSQCLGEKLAHDDADILHCVVLIDVEIAIGFEFQVERAVFREKLQHVIEETNARGDFVTAAALDAEFT